jgi:hypothetical protein
LVEQARGDTVAGADGTAGPAATLGPDGEGVAFGLTLGSPFAVAGPVGAAEAAPVADPEDAGGATETVVSGTTRATAGSAVSAWTCAAVTVAANALPVT